MNGKDVEQAAIRALRAHRRTTGLTQKTVAAAMREHGWKWHPDTVGDLEADRRGLRVGEFIDLAVIFSIHPASLLGADTEEQALRARIASEILGAA